MGLHVDDFVTARSGPKKVVRSIRYSNALGPPQDNEVDFGGN
jgi:hypothetical protein